MQENEEDTKKMESHHLSRSRQINKMFTPPKVICRFNVIAVVLLVSCFNWGQKK